MFDIVIIGGGVSGLYTHYLFEKNTDKKVLLLEGSNRFGGRIYQINDNVLNHNYSFPAGGARFNKNHHNVIKVLKEFKLLDFRSDKSFNAEVEFIDSKNEFEKNFKNKSGFFYINKIIQKSKQLDSNSLKKLSFKELAMMCLSKVEVNYMLVASGYSGQLKNMNAYDAVELFSNGIRDDLPYWGGKFHLLIDKIVNYLKENKCDLMLGSQVTTIKTNNENDLYEIKTKDNIFYGKQIIFCIPKPNLLKISYLKPIHNLLNNAVSCKPLCRTYAIFKKEDIWFQNLNKKVITNNNLRYIIPMDREHGLIMISYTDDIYTDFWKKIQNSQEKLKTQIVKLVKETFDINIKKPVKVYVCNWDCGVAYWNKNLDSDTVSDFIINPMPNIYIAGENYSLTQSWVEGALETSKKCFKLIK